VVQGRRWHQWDRGGRDWPVGTRERHGSHAAIAPSRSRSMSQSQMRAGDETYRHYPNRHLGRGSPHCPQEGGQGHVPMAPAVPPMAVQYVRGSHPGRPGRGTSPAPTAGWEPSTTKQEGCCWARGHGGAGPCVSLPPSHLKASTSLLPPQLHCPCSLFLCPCQIPALFLLLFFSSSGNPPAPPQAWGARGGRQPGPGEAFCGEGVRTP